LLSLNRRASSLQAKPSPFPLNCLLLVLSFHFAAIALHFAPSFTLFRLIIIFTAIFKTSQSQQTAPLFLFVTLCF
jgi:hypothetical protein